MANTVIGPIDLRTFIGQIHGIMQATSLDANGAVTAYPRKDPIGGMR